MAFARQRTFKSGVRWTGVYLDPDGRKRAAGSFATKRDALRAAHRQEQAVLRGQWHDGTPGAITFREFVERHWLPSKHIEATTRAAYVSNLDKHFFPFFGHRPVAKITPSLVQDWVTHAAAGGLSPRSIRKYHTMLHSIFKRAVRDQLILLNPCEHTELPKVIAGKTRTLTPDEFDALIHAVPEQHRLMVETAIQTGIRWGELIALRPRHIDFLRRTLTVEETIVEVSTKHSPTGERYLRKPYPKDNKPRTLGVRQTWLDAIAEHIKRLCCVDGSRRGGEGGSVKRARRLGPPVGVPSGFVGFRFPPEVILLAVRWYLRYGLSYRDLEELLAERGIEVDHVTLYRWVQRFTPLLIDAARPVRHLAGDRWFVDETYVKVAGVWSYVYRAVDQHGQVIDVYVSRRRDIGSARRFFTAALAVHGDPGEVITDRAPALANVVEEPVPAALHNTGRYENNRVECDHGRLKARLRPMRGVKTDRAASVVIRGHAFIQNLRRGHYELAVDAVPLFRLATAFEELRPAI